MSSLPLWVPGFRKKPITFGSSSHLEFSPSPQKGPGKREAARPLFLQILLHGDADTAERCPAGSQTEALTEGVAPFPSPQVRSGLTAPAEPLPACSWPWLCPQQYRGREWSRGRPGDTPPLPPPPIPNLIWSYTVLPHSREAGRGRPGSGTHSLREGFLRPCTSQQPCEVGGGRVSPFDRQGG